MSTVLKSALVAAFVLGSSVSAQAADIGEVSTNFKLLGPNDKVKIASFEDPKIAGITCFISRAVTGGLTGALGVAEDKSDASIACRQTGPIKYKAPISASTKGEEVFNESRSILFKALHVTRFFDAASGSSVYLTWSDKLINGSPKNSISAVTPQTWEGVAPEAPKLAK